jgi:hypothetical protein
MGDLVTGDLQITVKASPGLLRLDWIGKSNNREPGKVLGPFFDEIVRQAAASASSVEQHFEALQHFNSSTITALIQFIQTARARGIAVVIVYDAALKWQRLSFDALRIFEKTDGKLSFRTA